MNVLQIADPLDQDNPCGKNVRNDTSLRAIYYSIKDARNAARTAERGTDPGESIGVAPAWQDVNNLGLKLLLSDTKDIEVLAWLAEAQLRIRGFEGLRDVYTATASLLDNYFDTIHSIGDDDFEERFAPLAGLNGIGGEGTIIQPIRLTSLIADGKFAQFSLWDFQLGQRNGQSVRREELQQAASQVGLEAMTNRLQTVIECIEAHDRLTRILDERCGNQAPPSSNTRNALQEAAAAIRVLTGIEAIDPAPLAAPSDAQITVTSADQPPIDAATPRPLTADAIRSREQAFEMLAIVARYFRRTEPHSPIALSIETLLRRGRMDFSELLAELLPEQNTRHAVLTAAGINPATEKS